jgi:hypothetical protein
MSPSDPSHDALRVIPTAVVTEIQADLAVVQAEMRHCAGLMHQFLRGGGEMRQGELAALSGQLLQRLESISRLCRCNEAKITLAETSVVRLLETLPGWRLPGDGNLRVQADCESMLQGLHDIRRLTSESEQKFVVEFQRVFDLAFEFDAPADSSMLTARLVKKLRECS